MFLDNHKIILINHNKRGIIIITYEFTCRRNNKWVMQVRNNKPVKIM